MGFFTFSRRTHGAAEDAADPASSHVTAIVSAIAGFGRHRWPSADEVRSTAAWPALAAAPPEVRVAAAIEAFTRACDRGNDRDFVRATTLVMIGQEVLRSKLALTAEDRVALLQALTTYAARGSGSARLEAGWDHTRSVLRALERGGEVTRLPAEESLLRQVRAALIAGDTAESKRCLPRVDALLGVTPGDTLFSNPDWCARAIEGRLTDMEPGAREAGLAALRLATTASSARPSQKFLAQARELASAHGDEVVARALGDLLRSGALPVTGERGQVDPITGDALRGLCWVASVLTPTPELAASVGAWVTSGWIKIPGLGPRCRKAASGAIWALARLGEPGAAQLGRARALVKQPQAVAEIEAAIEAAAAALDIPREEFEERVVPTYDLEIGAVSRVTMGDFVATLGFDRGKAGISITGPDGRVRKTVPAAVREGYSRELAELKALAKDVSAMVVAQKLRLERLLMEERRWEATAWRERYLDHPLVSVVARPLIWQAVDPHRRVTAFIAQDGHPRDVHGDDVAVDGRIGLWHPATAATAEVESWRLRIEELGLVQPFKQAHREVYLLTDAERSTDIYSNRFAGHILRQHQFAALARARGWRYALQGAWDQPDGQATLRLSQHGVEVGFWVDRPWDADNDWNDAGVFNHVLSDQVRVTTLAGESVHLADLPVRLLSEVLRDVDLFVGVSSIGNDPAWRDSGDARQRAWGDYWTSYSFGALGAAAEVRRDLLARLIPRLAIRDVARIEDKFLVVTGSLRTYKIHLGSGNILMEPNDQYLCIVPGRSDDGPRDVMLPFEGDRVLSIVLSKALMLANDDAITDRTITSQIKRR